MINAILGQFKDQKKKVGEVPILALHKFFNNEKEKKKNLRILHAAQRDGCGAGRTCPEVVF